MLLRNNSTHHYLDHEKSCSLLFRFGKTLNFVESGLALCRSYTQRHKLWNIKKQLIIPLVERYGKVVKFENNRLFLC